MKQGYADITFVLDRSGSMSSIKEATISGFNAFLEEQKKAPGTATMSLYQFDDIYEPVYEGVDLSAVKPLDASVFVPRGSTALLDAIGRTVDAVGARLAKMQESDRPEKVVFVIQTDGQENASKEFTRARIDEMIRHQRDAYKWEFVFLGANQDAITVGAQLGFAAAASVTYAANTVGVNNALRSVSSNVASYRAGISKSITFDDVQRSAAIGNDKTESN